jgi:hypothetical protein
LGGISLIATSELSASIIEALIYLQYGLGTKGYSSSTCALDWDGDSSNNTYTFVDKYGLIHEQDDESKSVREGFKSEIYGATVGMPCDYEIWFEHTKPENDIYYVWMEETFLGLSILKKAFDRIGTKYIEDDHRLASTCIDAMM